MPDRALWRHFFERAPISNLKTETRVGEILSLPDGEDHSGCRALLEVLDRIGDKWTVMVVGVLAKGPTRFNAIQRAIGRISHRMLTRTLRDLERDGMVDRRAFATIPPKVEYELSSLGRPLFLPLDTLLGAGSPPHY